MRGSLALIASVLLLASLALAHGDEQHIMGTISNVTDSTVTVTTTKGKSVVVALTSQTTFSKEGSKITVKEIKQGDRVVIHAKKNGDKLEAASVQIGSAKSAEKMNMHE